MKFLLFLVMAILMLVKVQAEEITVSPEVFVQNVFALAQKENPIANPKVQAQLNSQFDWKQMSLNILGDEAKSKSASDLKWFEESIKEIITKTVYPKAPEFLQNVKIKYSKPLISDDSATVYSTISKKGESTDVAYTLVKASKDWRIIDVAIDGDSWVKTINTKIKQAVKDKGWNGVKDLLKKRIKTLNGKK